MYNIIIEVIPPTKQRYQTVGDWQVAPADVETRVFSGPPQPVDLLVRVSNTGDRRANCALIVHELVEAMLCSLQGVTQAEVDEWDMGPGAELDEPGDSQLAPYHDQHVKAELLERQLANFLGLEWDEYMGLIETAAHAYP